MADPTQNKGVEVDLFGAAVPGLWNQPLTPAARIAKENQRRLVRIEAKLDLLLNDAGLGSPLALSRAEVRAALKMMGADDGQA